MKNCADFARFLFFPLLTILARYRWSADRRVVCRPCADCCKWGATETRPENRTPSGHRHVGSNGGRTRSFSKGSLGRAQRDIQGLGSEMVSTSSDKSSTGEPKLFYCFRIERRHHWEN